MSGAIYDWMKNLAVFYIFLTVVMNLVPDSRYGEHIRFYMGLVLILLVLSPFLRLLRLGDVMEGLFEQRTMEQEYLDDSLRELEPEIQRQQQEIERRLREEYAREEETETEEGEGS